MKDAIIACLAEVIGLAGRLKAIVESERLDAKNDLT
jgi:hypothetical protein